MWILHFLPDTLIVLFVNLLLLAGIALTVAGWFAHRIPLVYQYQLPFKIAGGVLLAAGIYLAGGHAIETEWRERVQHLEQQLAAAKEESAKVNTVVETRVVTKTKLIKEKGDTLIERVEVMKEADCKVPAEVVDVHNEAARMNKIIEEQRKAKK